MYGQTFITKIIVYKAIFDVFGTWDVNTEKGKYLFYDVYLEGEWLTEGKPFVNFPTVDDLIPYAQAYMKENGYADDLNTISE